MFLQGDVEKNLGWKPIPLFDRDHAAEVASMQVKIVFWCTAQIYSATQRNLDQLSRSAHQFRCRNKY